jgi:thioredoxin-related protein
MRKSLLVVLGLAVGLTGSLCVSAGEWETDFAKASELAKKEGKHMLLDFSGSDWCGWCIKLDKEVFKKTEFKEYAKQNLVLVMLDFPHSKPQSKKLKEQNKELAQKYEIKGYPSVIILSPEGEMVGKTGYQPGGPEKYVEHLKTMIGKGKAAGEAAPATTEKKPTTTKPAKKK